MIWWHRLKGHHVEYSRVSIGTLHEKEDLIYTCECSRVWARQARAV